LPFAVGIFDCFLGYTIATRSCSPFWRWLLGLRCCLYPLSLVVWVVPFATTRVREPCPTVSKTPRFVQTLVRPIKEFFFVPRSRLKTPTKTRVARPLLRQKIVLRYVRTVSPSAFWLSDRLSKPSSHNHWRIFPPLVESRMAARSWGPTKTSAIPLRIRVCPHTWQFSPEPREYPVRFFFLEVLRVSGKLPSPPC